jgi:hypothetical protein
MSRALVAAFLCCVAAACSSKKPANTIPSEMLGPGGAEAPAEPVAAEQPVSPPPDTAPAATAADPAPAASAAPLTAAERALLAEMQAIMKEVTAQFEGLVSSLERAGGDCKKAATALSSSAKASSAIDQKMIAFKEKLSSGAPPSQALLAQLREATLAAFPVDTRARAETTFDALEKKCASDADFQRAKAEAAPRQ